MLYHDISKDSLIFICQSGTVLLYRKNMYIDQELQYLQVCVCEHVFHLTSLLYM